MCRTKQLANIYKSLLAQLMFFHINVHFLLHDKSLHLLVLSSGSAQGRKPNQAEAKGHKPFSCVFYAVLKPTQPNFPVCAQMLREGGVVSVGITS